LHCYIEETKEFLIQVQMSSDLEAAKDALRLAAEGVVALDGGWESAFGMTGPRARARPPLKTDPAATTPTDNPANRKTWRPFSSSMSTTMTGPSRLPLRAGFARP